MQTTQTARVIFMLVYQRSVEEHYFKEFIIPVSDLYKEVWEEIGHAKTADEVTIGILIVYGEEQVFQKTTVFPKKQTFCDVAVEVTALVCNVLL